MMEGVGEDGRGRLKGPTMADKFDALSPEDQAKLALLEADWEREGDIVFERWGEKDPAFMLKLYAQDRPQAVYDAIENAVIDAGWTNADIRAMLEKAQRERKH
jgi:hypothetical protein